MSTFVDQMLIRFLEDAFVEDLLGELGLANLFDLTYETQDIELMEIALADVHSRQFQMPVFETIHTTGTEERVMPVVERVQIKYERPRYGRLEWVDVFLRILLSTRIHNTGSPIGSITTEDLIERLGGADSITELRQKLEDLYPESIVDALFSKLHITSIEEFKRRGKLFMQAVYETAPPYDPTDPQNVRTFYVNVCVKFQTGLDVAETLKSIKLCRSIMENERTFAGTFDGGEIDTPYIFVVVFPDEIVEDNAIPGLSADQIRASITNLFANEKALAYFHEES